MTRIEEFDADFKDLLDAIPKTKKLRLFDQASRIESRFKKAFALLAKLRNHLSEESVMSEHTDEKLIAEIDEVIKE